MGDPPERAVPGIAAHRPLRDDHQADRNEDGPAPAIGASRCQTPERRHERDRPRPEDATDQPAENPRAHCRDKEHNECCGPGCDEPLDLVPDEVRDHVDDQQRRIDDGNELGISKARRCQIRTGEIRPPQVSTGEVGVLQSAAPPPRAIITAFSLVIGTPRHRQGPDVQRTRQRRVDLGDPLPASVGQAWRTCTVTGSSTI